MKNLIRAIHNTRIGTWLPTLLLLALLAFPANPGLALPAGLAVIDPFTREQCAGLVCSPSQPVVADPAILGGERDVLADRIAGTGALRVWGAGWPVLSVENGPPDGLSSYLVVWDGPDGDETSIDYDGLGANLTAGCAPDSAYFELHQTYLDRQVAYTITVYTDEDDWSTWSSGVVEQSDAHFTIPLADFAATTGSGADWQDVGAISLLIDTSVETTADLSLAPFRFGCTPTAVRLARFEAARRGNAVALEWETVTEIDNLGFNLYRAISEDGPRTRLNEALIPSQAPGSPVGAVYTWPDETVQPGIGYYYWLEDVDIYGLTTLHGPIHVDGPAITLRRRLPQPGRLP